MTFTGNKRVIQREFRTWVLSDEFPKPSRRGLWSLAEYLITAMQMEDGVEYTATSEIDIEARSFTFSVTPTVQ